MRGVNGHDSVETVVAAANAIASAESRVQPGSAPRRRWKAWLHMYWCCGSQGQPNRISQAVLVPEPAEMPVSPTLANSNQSSGLVVAPPSSPSSLLQSEPPSTIQSPAKFFSLSYLASNSYSPVRSSIFDVGPYANDTKLVSPPVFSTFTTEPSTAPFTPPEPLQQTTPSSPEVPFARLLSSSSNGKIRESGDFQPYLLHPGSPIGHLISPGSVCSGTSSPFSDMELHPSSDASFASLPIARLPPNILTAGDFTKRKLRNGRAARDNGSILDGQITAIQPSVDESGSMLDNAAAEGEDISFEFASQEFEQRMKKQPATSADETSVSPIDLEETMCERDQLSPNGTNHKFPEKTDHLSELEASREFKFNIEADNGGDEELGILHSRSAWSQLKFGFAERIH